MKLTTFFLPYLVLLVTAVTSLPLLAPENLFIVVYNPWEAGQRYHWALFLTKKASVAANTQGTIYQLRYDNKQRCLSPQQIDNAQPNKWPRELLLDKVKLMGQVERVHANQIYTAHADEFAADLTRCQEWTKKMTTAMLGHEPAQWPDSEPPKLHENGTYNVENSDFRQLVVDVLAPAATPTTARGSCSMFLRVVHFFQKFI